MAEFLTDDEAAILDGLRAKIARFEGRNRLRRNYFEGEELLVNLGFSIPEGMESFQSVLGWPRKAVSVFASRLQPAGFTSGRAEDGLVEDIEDMLAGSMFEMLERLAIEAACRYGVSFVFTTRGDTSIGEPEIVASVRSARTATVDMDFRTWRVKSALEVTGPRSYNLYLPYEVLMIERKGGRWIKETIPTGTPLVQCAPYVQGAIIGKELGQSRITRPLMKFTDAGVRTLLRQEVSAEFYSAPRQALLGADDSMFMDENGRVRPGWLSILGGIWGIPDALGEDDEPDPDLRPEFKNFPQMSMQPFSDQFRMIAQQVSGETSIPPSYLGVVADSNPTSAQAIFANEIDLINEVKSQWPSFNLGRLQLAKNVFHLWNQGRVSDVESLALGRLKSRWVDPRTRSVQEQSQFVAQQVSSGNFQPGSETTLRQLPIDPDDIELFASEARRGSGLSILSEIANGENVGPAEGAGSILEDPVKEANAMKAKLDALGVGVRAGATFDSLKLLLGLDGVENSGAVPVMLRMPESEAAAYEGG
ncbi:phage portal protein [Flaviflexus massiliensis]|uniref:phage portal protein n=1 Tax=Flaviflexus massiliensis TaxID=1522309 RepID=UPI0006D5486B|nr:phage portal protein [Flaviflexus massiliensis]